MIQTKIQFNLKNAKQYFREHLGAGDYYSEGQKVTGEWLGAGAEKLGLKGPVGEDAFIALCEGKHPETGLRLGQRLNSVRHEGDDVKANRRIFFDLRLPRRRACQSSPFFRMNVFWRCMNGRSGRPCLSLKSAPSRGSGNRVRTANG